MKKTCFRILKVAVTFVLCCVLFVACGNPSSKSSEKNVSSTSETTDNEVSVAASVSESAISEENETTEETKQPEQESNTQDLDIINLDVLKEIEENDTFAVKVSGDHVVSFNITNSTNEEIHDVVILLATYNDKNVLKKIPAGISAYGEDPYVTQLITNEDFIIKAGETIESGFRCNLKGHDITGIRAIVYSYTTSDDTVYDNDSALEWYKNYKVGRSTIVD